MEETPKMMYLPAESDKQDFSMCVLEPCFKSRLISVLLFFVKCKYHY
jgi:hypothetical protein